MKNTIYILAILLLLGSCKKRKKETMVVDITAVNPVTQTPFKGVKFYITEVTTKKKLIGNAYEYEQIYAGETDGSGHVYYEFEIPQDYKWTYEINFDFTQMDVAEGDYYLRKGLHFDYLQRDEVNSFNFELMPYGEFLIHTKNTACYDSSDLMIKRVKNLYTGSGQWSSWSNFDGCFEYISQTVNKPQDVIVYEMEITKNNITTTVIDTFYNNPNQIDTMKYFY